MHNQVEIYTTDFVVIINVHLQLLNSYNISYRQYDLTLDKEEEKQCQTELGQNFCATNFINDIHIGGSEELIELSLNGKLKELLNC